MSIRTLAAALAALLVTAPASAEVVQQGPNAFTTRDSVVVKASRFEVWQALIAPAGWWNKAHTWSGDAANLYISAQANGCFCELLPAPEGAPQEVRRGSALHMTVIQADPGHVLRMRGGLGPLQSEPAEGVLTIALGEVDGGTRIVWEYVVGGSMRYEVPVISKAVDGVMSEQLRGLARLLGPADEEEKSPAKAGAKPEPAEKEPAEKATPDKAPAKPKVAEAFEDLIGEE
ncbi:MAG: SRPBCC family protein [Sphingomonadaceae bacterium]